jgi:hypothetical protein
MWMTGKHFFDGTPDPINGKMRIPDRPGLGFTPNYDALKDGRVKDPEASRLKHRDAHGYLLREAIPSLA